MYPAKYMSLKASVNLWLKWCLAQGIDPANFLWQVQVLMDRCLPKKNCMCIVRPTNAGKTVIIANPLIAIAKYCGRVTNAAVASNFAWQDCSNQRLISVEEALFAGEHQEKLKQLAGGETCTVDRKHMTAIQIERTPMLLTANYDRWQTNVSNKDPLLARMFYHRVISLPFLERMTMPLHPGIYYFLLTFMRKQTGVTTSVTYVPFSLSTDNIDELHHMIEEFSVTLDDDMSDVDDDDEDEEPAAKYSRMADAISFD